MRPRNHPPIAKSSIKSLSMLSAARNRMPAPSPHRYLLPAFLRTRILLRHSNSRSGHYEEKNNRGKKVEQSRERHGLTRLPDKAGFCKFGVILAATRRCATKKKMGRNGPVH